MSFPDKALILPSAGSLPDVHPGQRGPPALERNIIPWERASRGFPGQLLKAAAVPLHCFRLFAKPLPSSSCLVDVAGLCRCQIFSFLLSQQGITEHPQVSPTPFNQCLADELTIFLGPAPALWLEKGGRQWGEGSREGVPHGNHS